MSDDRPVALLTNTADYVGPALSRLLAGSGHRLVLHGPRQELVDELTAGGHEVEVVAKADLTTAEGNQTLVDAALGRWGRLDAACFLTGFIVTGRFLEAKVDDWDFVKRANLDMVFHALQAALPTMVEAGRGQIVVYTSARRAPDPSLAFRCTRRRAPVPTRGHPRGGTRVRRHRRHREHGGHELHGLPRLPEGDRCR